MLESEIKMKSLSDRIYSYHTQKWKLPSISEPIRWINPFVNSETKAAFKIFHDKYYNDQNKRIYLLGINPGRLGAGVTGVAFTDPVRLQEICGINNSFKQRSELSSIFIYEVIEAYGGPEIFYRDFALSSVCPLGFTKMGKNYNYYDDKHLYGEVEGFIIKHLKSLKKLGADSNYVVSLGKGKNFKYLAKLNQAESLFENCFDLPHPRWVMQYKLKEKDKYIQTYVELLTRLKQQQSC